MIPSDPRKPILIVAFLLHVSRRSVADAKFELIAQTGHADSVVGMSLSSDTRRERGRESFPQCAFGWRIFRASEKDSRPLFSFRPSRERLGLHFQDRCTNLLTRMFISPFPPNGDAILSATMSTELFQRVRPANRVVTQAAAGRAGFGGAGDKFGGAGGRPDVRE
jgi:hypothetical protein